MGTLDVDESAIPQKLYETGVPTVLVEGGGYRNPYAMTGKTD